MKLPTKFTVEIAENDSIYNPNRRAREWCGSFVSAMVWLSSAIPDASYVFRGHADLTWNFESTLFRVKGPDNLERLLSEEELILKSIAQDFWFEREFGFVPARNDRTLAVLQHNGIPTRLLDATADPLVALYFAVVGGAEVDDMDKLDGAVMFIRNVNPENGLPIHVFRAPQVSPRVTAQRGYFVAPTPGAQVGKQSYDTVLFDFFAVSVSNESGTDFDNLMDNFLRGDFKGRPPEKAPNILLFKIPSGLKSACRSVLQSLGVSASTLFPGSEGYRRDFAGF
jgi:FRG domain-containing protein